MISGTKLRKFRDSNKISQAEVADAVGVHQSTYSDWESEKSQPHFKYWAKLAEVLKTELTALLLEGATLPYPMNESVRSNTRNTTLPPLDVTYLIDNLFKSKDSECHLWSVYCNHLKIELDELKHENKKLAEENDELKLYITRIEKKVPLTHEK
jgi:transcriptional regulator with XRE-family HTH domain